MDNIGEKSQLKALLTLLVGGDTRLPTGQALALYARQPWGWVDRHLLGDTDAGQKQEDSDELDDAIKAGELAGQRMEPSVVADFSYKDMTEAMRDLESIESSL